MQQIGSKLFELYLFVVKRFTGTNIGNISAIKALHRRLLYMFRSTPIKVNNYYMYIGDESARKYDSGQALLLNGNMEPYTTAIFRQVITENMNIVDIGANIGYFSLLAASIIGNKGKVFAFEPDPDNYEILVKNIKLNGYKNVVSLPKAVSNKNGTSTFFQYDPTGWSSFFSSNANPVGVISVETVTLDDYFSNIGLIDVVKIDVEGAEILVLEGMKKVIEKNDNIKIFIEFNPGCIENAEFSKMQFWNTMTLCGLKYFYLIDDVDFKTKRVEYEDMVDIFNSKFESIGFANLLCTKIPLTQYD